MAEKKEKITKKEEEKIGKEVVKTNNKKPKRGRGGTQTILVWLKS